MSMRLRLWWRIKGVPQSIQQFELFCTNGEFVKPMIAMVKGLRNEGYEAGLIKLQEAEERLF